MTTTNAINAPLPISVEQGGTGATTEQQARDNLGITIGNRTIQGTAGEIVVDNGDGLLGDPIISIASDPTIPGANAVQTPSGTTAQRPGSPNVGMIRGNTDTNETEVFSDGTWTPIVGDINNGVDVYVSKQIGSDIDGTGSFQSPYQTINFALTQIGIPAFPVTVEIIDGESYDETIVLASSLITIYGPQAVVAKSTAGTAITCSSGGNTVLLAGISASAGSALSNSSAFDFIVSAKTILTGTTLNSGTGRILLTADILTAAITNSGGGNIYYSTLIRSGADSAGVIGINPAGTSGPFAVLGALSALSAGITNGITAGGTIAGNAVTSTTTMIAGTLVQGATVNSTGGMTAGGTIQGTTVNATGAMSAGTSLSGNTISSTTTVTAGTTVSGATVSATGAVTAGTSVSGNTVSATTTVTAGTAVSGNTVSATTTVTAGTTVNGPTHNAGASGVAGTVNIFAPSVTGGRLAVTATNNTASALGTLTNQSISSARNWFLPSTAQTNTTLLPAKFTNVDPASNIIFVDATITFTQLAGGGATIFTATAGGVYVVRTMRFNAGSVLTGGNRNIEISAGATIYSTIPTATVTVSTSRDWGSTQFPFPTVISPAAPTGAGVSLLAVNSGGTTNYTGGSIVITLGLERIV